MRGGSFNLSFVFCLWLIWIFLLGLKIKAVSGWGWNYKTKTERMEIPALGRTAYGIGSLYDGRTGNFLPPEFSVISGKSLLLLSPHFVNRTRPSSIFRSQEFPMIRPSHKIQLVFEQPNSGDYYALHKDFDGLALRAVLEMLDFPENGTAGVLLDKVTQQEMNEPITNYTSSTSYKFEDDLIFPETGAGTNQSLQDKLLQREIRRNLKGMDMKILKKATHVVVKVTRGSNSVKTYTATSSRIFSDDPIPPADFNSDSTLVSMLEATLEQFTIRRREGATVLSPATPGGVPLFFKMMPLLQFLKETGLKLSPSSRRKFIALEESNWKNPMDIRHGRTFENLDWSWLLIRQMTKLNTTLHQCLKDNPRKDKERGEEMIQDLENLHENFTQKLTTYKGDLKSLLEKSSTGTEQDKKLWDSLYLKEWEAVGTGMHWDFHRDLEAAQKKVFSLGGEKVTSDTKYNQYIVGGDERKIGCDAIPEIKN